MKKSLLSQEAVDELIVRIERLKPDSDHRWGTMRVTEMLLHCTLADRFILEDKSPYQKPTLKERVIKFVALHIISAFPRNRKGPARLKTTGKIDVQYFEEQKKAFVDTLLLFPKRKEPMTSIHPGMGYLNNKEWGVAAWMHMDHHLRQFGV